MTNDAGLFRSSDDPILLTSDGKVATVTFNRPATLNVVDAEMTRAMRHVADALADDQECRVVVLRGHGPAFMAGGDVRASRRKRRSIAGVAAANQCRFPIIFVSTSYGDCRSQCLPSCMARPQAAGFRSLLLRI